ncbi:MAG: carboxypeptidase-like regulatory domain-containing protein [Ferruginibacter sp.]
MKLPIASCCSFILFLFSFTSTAQFNIQGRILNGETDQPIQGASIYFNGTSIGTSSAADGRFIIYAAVLNTELVISCVGYETVVYKPDAAVAAGKTLVFKMKVKEQQLGEVLVVPDAVRKRWLSIFKTNFLGQTEEASKSSIANLKDIYFMKGGGRNSFKAYCDTSLVITNKMLGYKISFDLVEFSINEEEHSTYFYGYTRYEEMGDKKKWLRNRRNTYYGSTMHFYRSLIAGNLDSQGYKIYLLKPVKMKPDTGSQNVIRVNSGNGNKMTMALAVQPGKIFKTDSVSTDYILSLSTQLMIQYSKEPASKKYIKDHINFIQGYLPTGFQAFITLGKPSIKIYKEGIVDDPAAIFYGGYWMYEKAANLLPLNYSPD